MLYVNCVIMRLFTALQENSNLGAMPWPCYIGNRVITRRVIMRLDYFVFAYADGWFSHTMAHI